MSPSAIQSRIRNSKDSDEDDEEDDEDEEDEEDEDDGEDNDEEITPQKPPAPPLRDSGKSKIQATRSGLVTRSQGTSVSRVVTPERTSSLPRPRQVSRIRVEDPLPSVPVSPSPRATRSKGKGKQRQISPPALPTVPFATIPTVVIPPMPTRASTREELKERVPQITAPDLLAMGSFLLETDNVSPPSISSISFQR